jgi:hypothetical protein
LTRKAREWLVPMPDALAAELKLSADDSVLSGWMFEGERKSDQPMDRHLFDKWLHVAEKKAKFPKLVSGLWHPYR